MAEAVGIDLGTTNSVIAVREAGEPTVVPNAESSRTTPSVVGFAKSGDVLVGEVAKRQSITNPDRTIRSVKRHMGTTWATDIDGKEYTAQENSARILQRLKELKDALAGSDVEAIRSATDRLMSASQAVAQQLYEQATPSAPPGAGTSGPGSEPGSDDEVVDAEIVDEG